MITSTPSLAIPDTATQQLGRLLALICEELQITDSMHNMAELRYVTIGEWLSGPDSALSRWSPQVYPQGSLRIGTTVRPWRQEEFDLDLVCQLAIQGTSVDPVKVLELVYQRLKNHNTYAPMVAQLKRCIRINYEGTFHLDILPAIPAQPHGNDTSVLVPDRELHEWLPSNPRGYAQWFENQAEHPTRVITADVDPLPDKESVNRKATLKKSVQLLKRWRDIVFQDDPDSAPRSIVLTTLAGEVYAGEQSVPNAFGNIVSSIAGRVSSSVEPLVVVNPANEGEILSERWQRDKNSYILFSDRISELDRIWQTLQQARGIPAVQAILQQLFGEKLGLKVIARHTEEIESARQRGVLGVGKRLGLTTTAPVAAVLPNRFYGGKPTS